MSIKDSTFKKINWAYIILSVILGLVLVYGIVNTMVSLKYENEKELIDLFVNRFKIRIDQFNIVQISAIHLEQLLYVPRTNILNIRTYDINHSVYYDRKCNDEVGY